MLEVGEDVLLVDEELVRELVLDVGEEVLLADKELV